MKKLILASAVISLGFSTTVMAENNYMPKYLEKGLVQICKSAALDKNGTMINAIKEYRLNTKLVALNVVCNGQDIISFAERYGAKRTTAKLSNSIGSVQVTDIASINNSKYDVTFDFD